MPTNSFEVRGKWPLKNLPEPSEPWMETGRMYVIVLRRNGPDTLPEAEVRDEATDEVLATYTWLAARTMFDLPNRPGLFNG